MIRRLYHQILFWLALFRLKKVNNIILIDFDFTLVQYSLEDSTKGEILSKRNYTIDSKVSQYLENKNSYIFTARGLKSSLFVSGILKKARIRNKVIYLGSTRNKIKTISILMKSRKLTWIDDLADFNTTNNQFIKHKMTLHHPNLKFFYNVD